MTASINTYTQTYTHTQSSLPRISSLCEQHHLAAFCSIHAPAYWIVSPTFMAGLPSSTQWPLSVLSETSSHSFPEYALLIFYTSPSQADNQD